MECALPGKPKASTRLYSDYVKAQSSRNPCLLNLECFLSKHAAGHRSCRIVALDFREGVKGLCARSNVALHDLPSKLRGNDDLGNSLQGRIFIIEDLTEDVVELLGLELDIDPLFFAMHLHVSQKEGLKHQPPSEVTLPSRLLNQNYININYHRSVTSDCTHKRWSRYMRDTVISRNLVFLPSTNVGLAQHCTSVFRTRQKDSFWIGLYMCPIILFTHSADKT